MSGLTKHKKLIQNAVIIVAIGYVFGTAGTAYFWPDLITDDLGVFSEFQKITLDNSTILIVVIVTGAITAIALDTRDKQSEEIINKLIERLAASKPN